MTSLEDVLAEDFIPTDRPMRIGRYLLGAVLGEGKSAVVRRAVREGDKKKVAVKVLNKLAGHQGSLVALQFQQEVEALRRTSHRHVIDMHDCLQSHRRFYVVLELLTGDLLSYHVERRCGLPEYETQMLTSQLTSGLTYLHKAHIVHRDLKPDNIMIDSRRLDLKIIDFGLSATCSSLPQLTRHCGTPAYMAPEILTCMGYGCLVDMWSLGVTIVEILTGYAPHIHDQKKRGTCAKLIQRREMFASLPALSKDCLNFLDGLLQMFPEKRLTSQEAHAHRWLKTRVCKPPRPAAGADEDDDDDIDTRGASNDNDSNAATSSSSNTNNTNSNGDSSNSNTNNSNRNGDSSSNGSSSKPSCTVTANTSS